MRWPCWCQCPQGPSWPCSAEGGAGLVLEVTAPRSSRDHGKSLGPGSPVHSRPQREEHGRPCPVPPGLGECGAPGARPALSSCTESLRTMGTSVQTGTPCGSPDQSCCECQALSPPRCPVHRCAQERGLREHMQGCDPELAWMPVRPFYRMQSPAVQGLGGLPSTLAPSRALLKAGHAQRTAPLCPG